MPTLGVDALKMPAATDFWALHFAQFWVDYEGTRGGKGRPQPFVDSFPLTVWACQPAKIVQHQERLRVAAGPGLSRSTSGEAIARLQRKRLLKEYYSTDGASISSHSNESPLAPSNGLHKRLSLDSFPSASSLSSSDKDAGAHILVHVQKPLSAQVCRNVVKGICPGNIWKYLSSMYVCMANADFFFFIPQFLNSQLFIPCKLMLMFLQIIALKEVSIGINQHTKILDKIMLKTPIYTHL